jgi:hypothetical protein
MATLVDNIPADAITIFYKAGRRGAEYSFWKRYTRHCDEIWYWSALGNCGVADDAEEAKDAAKRWIREH